MATIKGQNLRILVGEDDEHLGKYSPYTETQRKILRKFFVTATAPEAFTEA